MDIGAAYHRNGNCTFILWGPLLSEVTLDVVHPVPRKFSMEKDQNGYWKVTAEDVCSGTRYYYLLDQKKRRSDPASHYQPEGVHGPSEVVDHRNFLWEDQSWQGLALEEMIMYELHVGTFTPEGTFEAVISRLRDLKDLGINAINIMPVSQFPGERNWGYDGVYPYAVQNSYGGPNGLKKLVNACHNQGFAALLDVVYNHLGPEGNYLADFGPYFTETYKTPWGQAVNFDGPYSDGVRDYFINNALYWFRHYHIDALRLDAIHGIYDMSAKHILEELAEEGEQFSQRMGRKFFFIPESDLNNPRTIRPRTAGGYGMDAQWCDDFHHCLHTLLTGEKTGYYVDFGSIADLKKSLEEGYVFSGQYSTYRKRRHGAPSTGIPARQFVVFSQNHDQVGNRILGERLSALIDFEGLKLAAGAVIISPYIPLFFMGEEYGERSPFPYFISHSDPGLIEAVREGRKREFRSFKWEQDPPDPYAEETFLAAKLQWEIREDGNNRVLLEFYRTLLRLRKENPALNSGGKEALKITINDNANILVIRRWHLDSMVMAIMNFGRDEHSPCLDMPDGSWEKILNSSDKQWMGPGSLMPDMLMHESSPVVPPLSIILYRRI